MEDILQLAKRYPRGTQLHVKHDGFHGRVIGYYITLENKPGLVLQFDATRMVHVYSTKWFEQDHTFADSAWTPEPDKT